MGFKWAHFAFLSSEQRGSSPMYRSLPPQSPSFIILNKKRKKFLRDCSFLHLPAHFSIHGSQFIKIYSQTDSFISNFLHTYLFSLSLCCHIVSSSAHHIPRYWLKHSFYRVPLSRSTRIRQTHNKSEEGATENGKNMQKRPIEIKMSQNEREKDEV